MITKIIKNVINLNYCSMKSGLTEYTIYLKLFSLGKAFIDMSNMTLAPIL